MTYHPEAVFHTSETWEVCTDILRGTQRHQNKSTFGGKNNKNGEKNNRPMDNTLHMQLQLNMTKYCKNIIIGQ